MTFKSVKSNLITIMSNNEYNEADVTDFESAPALEYDNSFIVQALSGEMGSESETLVDRFYDIQDWQILIAYSKSSQSDIINRDEAQRKREILITALDKPANWSNYVRLQKYKSWKLEELKSYYLLTINIKIIDQVIY